MQATRILISGGGIAGLTLAIELKRRGFEPLVIEREPGLRAEGYMMDFFGTGWDVAERMGLIERLRAVRYPIDTLEFVDADGKPYVHMPIERMRQALGGNYVYLRRPDLERILAERASELGVVVRYGCSLAAIEDRGNRVHAEFDSGDADDFALAIGADGVNSRLRELGFGPVRQFARFLGLYVGAFHVARGGFAIDRAVKLYEETDRTAFLYPLDAQRLDATYVFRQAAVQVAQAERLAFLRERYRGAGWIVEDVLRACAADEPIFFDSVTQIVMPNWHKGRLALIGDACGCLTLLAGQGSHMAMADAYLLAEALARESDHQAAFSTYQAFMKPAVDKRQRDAARFAGMFVPSPRSRPWLRRLTIELFFSAAVLRFGLALFGSKSVLAARGRD
jgi:2-polyprenyl-6-methoxyphenol hydroxylase-like FAD-dependent oxidoreductase